MTRALLTAFSLSVLVSSAYAATILPNVEGIECPEESTVNLATFNLKTGQLESAQRDTNHDGVVTAKVQVYSAHSFVDTVVFILKDGTARPWVVDMPIPSGWKTSWARIDYGKAKSIDAVSILAADLGAVRTRNKYQTSIRVIGCKVDPRATQ